MQLQYYELEVSQKKNFIIFCVFIITIYRIKDICKNNLKSTEIRNNVEFRFSDHILKYLFVCGAKNKVKIPVLFIFFWKELF